MFLTSSVRRGMSSKTINQRIIREESSANSVVETIIKWTENNQGRNTLWILNLNSCHSNDSSSDGWWGRMAKFGFGLWVNIKMTLLLSKLRKNGPLRKHDNLLKRKCWKACGNFRFYVILFVVRIWVTDLIIRLCICIITMIFAA